MTGEETPETRFEVTFGKDLFQATTVHINVGQEVIMVTEDKLRLCLMAHSHALAVRVNWVAPVSLLVTILLVFASTDFRQFIFAPDTWRAVFAICGTGAAVWATVAIVKAGRVRTSIGGIVAELKLATPDKRPDE